MKSSPAYLQSHKSLTLNDYELKYGNKKAGPNAHPASDQKGSPAAYFSLTPWQAATRRLDQLPYRAFVRKLGASGYPLHLPQAKWANCRTPTRGL